MLISENTLLKIEDLKTYVTDNGRLLRIVDGVSFDIREGEVVALFGECGCGKTTTAFSIVGAIRDIPGVVGGNIYLQGAGSLLKNGKYDKEKMENARGKGVFLVMQGAKSSLNPFWQIKRQVGYVSKNKEVKNILEKLCLGDKIEQFPHKLSGGECQRALLAMGLLSLSKLLIIDEPTVGIDEKLGDKIIELLKEYKEDRSGCNSNRAILLISHDLEIIKKLADRIVVMCSGRIVEEGNKEEIINNPRHPYTERLIKSFQISTKEVLPVINGVPQLFYEEYKGCRFYSRCEVGEEKCLLSEPGMSGNDSHWVRCYFKRINND